MVIIEVLVYVCIAALMVFCLNVIYKERLAKRSDFIYFGVILSLIGTQIFIQISPEIRGSIDTITYICLGTISALAFIYFITRIMVSTAKIHADIRVWIGWTMFLVLGISICALLIKLPDTKADLFRIPFALALCIGMAYYPLALDRLKASRNSSEQRPDEHEDAILDTATATDEEHKETVLDIATETNIEEYKDAVINLVTESWRFTMVYQRMLTNLDVSEHKKYTSQLRWHVKKLEESLEEGGLRIVNVEGHPYDPGMAATPVNIEDFDTDELLVVNRMLEPIIMEGTVLVKTGKVTVRRIE
jgi:hypothetical protein